MNSGKKITLFLTSGLPKGLREVKIDQWSGKAICGPRNTLRDIISLPEIGSSACVYFLVSSSDEGGLSNIYIGETDGFRARVVDHDNKKDWWDVVIAFVSLDGSLTKTGIQYLESVCVKRLKEGGKCIVKNANNPTLPSVPREDISGLELFYSNIATIMPLLGYDFFVEGDESSNTNKKRSQIFLCKKGKNVTALANLLNDGKMKVLKNSTASIEDAQSFKTHPYKKLKDELVKMKRLLKKEGVFVFASDYVFDSPSAACDVVLGRSASGPLEWKTDEGINLKEYVNSQIQ